MSKLKIVTYKQGIEEGTIKIPLTLARMISTPFLNRLNSEQAQVIREAFDIKDYQGVILEIEEHKTDERIIFFIE
ncbi:hypothetical protein [Vibrio atypicus]|uniref:hypothetical protein n=1 Tax=Vibrio atypicus TaxID=558271 RepID=UPI00135B9DBB|nr:hypothetical protein [Vibrio atypicus]